MRRIFWIPLICFTISAMACKKPSEEGQPIKTVNVRVEPPLPEAPPTVVFDMKPADPAAGSAGFQVYDCNYTAAGKTARFRLAWKQTGALSGQIPMARVEGKFLALSGSDNSILLTELKKVLEAKEIPKKVSRVTELPFDAILFGGGRKDRDPSGDWRDKTSADWILLKLFLPKGGDDGEMFLYVNPVVGKAEFSIKDEEYGDYLLGQLAKVL